MRAHFYSFMFFLSVTGRNEITLVIFMEKSFFKNIFNRFIFKASVISLIDDFNCNIYVNVKYNNINNNSNNNNNNNNNDYRVDVRPGVAMPHGHVGVFSLGW